MARNERVLSGEQGDRFAKEIIIGGEQKPNNGVLANRRTVLLLGRSRSGKTSLISAFANYLFDVKEEDNFRYTIVPMHRRMATLTSISSLSRDGPKISRMYARTKHLTCYVFNNTILRRPLAFVDTPAIDVDLSSRSWPQNDAFEQIRRWLREGYYCPIEDLEVWLTIPSFDSHVRQCVWQTVNSVMREIESPLVRLIPIITFARNYEPRQALNSLAQAGYDGLMEGENFYTFNSASVLNTDGNTLDCDGLSFADNYKHIYSILYNMQKSFQWMTMADDSAVTTLIQVHLNRENDSRTRLYAAGSFRLDRCKTDETLGGFSTAALSSSTLIQSIDVDANNAANVIGNDKTRVNNSHRTNDEDNAELTSMNTTCTGSFVNATTDNAIELTRNCNFYETGIRLISFKPLHKSPIDVQTAEDGSLDGNLVNAYCTISNPTYSQSCKSASKCATGGSTSNLDSTDPGSRVTDNASPQVNNSAMETHRRISPSRRNDRRSHCIPSDYASFIEWHVNERDQDSFGNGSLASRGPLQNNVRLLTSNRSRQLERHPTGIEYEVIRFRRRRVKNESTQTSPDRMRHAVSVEKSIYMSSELDSDESEYFASDIKAHTRRPKSFHVLTPQLALVNSSGILKSDFKETWV
uniref:Uncharacterized protein n=1 Tax=Parascaris univalens TaxID=6257 RepID=A0A915C6A8_PARUN